MPRRRYSFVLVAFVLMLAAATAQPPREPTDGKFVVPLTVDSTAPPVPALKYHLLPELRETQTGNQVPAFYKCFFEQSHFYGDKEAVAQRKKWSAAPLADLAGVKELIGYGGVGLRQADYAARLDAVDWAVLNQLKAEGIYLLLPDVQKMRQLAAALMVRMRGEVARKDYPAALRTAQTMFALARAFNDHPTLIGQLVGIAIVSIELGVIEEFMQQPGSPNLFWALAELPAPLIDLRKGMQGERALLPRFYEAFRKTDPVGEPELNRMVKEIETWVADTSSGKKEAPGVWYAKQAGDPAAVTAAKGRLAKLGYDPAALDKLSTLQIVMTDDFARAEVYRDDRDKWMTVPFWRVPAEAMTAPKPEGVLAELAPAAAKVRDTQVRTQQRLAMLQTVEAVRAHVTANGGKLSATLDDIKLPVPLDPVTGKAFRYEVKDGTAVVSSVPPARLKNDPYFNRVYEITIRK